MTKNCNHTRTDASPPAYSAPGTVSHTDTCRRCKATRVRAITVGPGTYESTVGKWRRVSASV